MKTSSLTTSCHDRVWLVLEGGSKALDSSADTNAGKNRCLCPVSELSIIWMASGRIDGSTSTQNSKLISTS